MLSLRRWTAVAKARIVARVVDKTWLGSDPLGVPFALRQFGLEVLDLGFQLCDANISVRSPLALSTGQSGRPHHEIGALVDKVVSLGQFGFLTRPVSLHVSRVSLTHPYTAFLTLNLTPYARLT